MAFDWGYIIAGAIVIYIIGISYKKKTGQPLSELWRGIRGDKELPQIQDYRKVYVTKGIKQ